MHSPKETYGEKEIQLNYGVESNHLGNVLATISARPRLIFDNQTFQYKEADVMSVSDYFGFGMEMPGRQWNSENYDWGFNGKYNDNEINGWQDYGERMYSRLTGRFPTADKLIVKEQKYPWYSPYQFAGNKPIWAVDLDGEEEYTRTDYIDANGNLYKTEIEMVTSFGAQNNIQTVHHSFVQANNNNTFTKTFTGTTEGTTQGTNAFTSPMPQTPNETALANFIIKSALKVDNNRNPVILQYQQPVNVRVFDFVTGTVQNVTANQSSLSPGSGKTLEPGYTATQRDVNGNILGSEIDANNQLKVYTGGYASTKFTLNQGNNNANIFTGTAPTDDVSNINAVPKNPMNRGGTQTAPSGNNLPKPLGINFNNAQGGSGTTFTK